MAILTIREIQSFYWPLLTCSTTLRVRWRVECVSIPTDIHHKNGLHRIAVNEKRALYLYTFIIRASDGAGGVRGVKWLNCRALRGRGGGGRGRRSSHQLTNLSSAFLVWKLNGYWYSPIFATHWSPWAWSMQDKKQSCKYLKNWVW